jgi:ribosome-binding protein aMBF1 (putative translation factor)
MEKARSVAAWMQERGMREEQLREAAVLDAKVFAAILQGRYTPSPEQRRRLAAALGVEVDQIAWGHVNPVAHVYGHGPQFGRSP